MNYYAPTLDRWIANNDVIFLKKSVVCLEQFYMKQMDLPSQLKESFSKYLGGKDEDQEDPCDEPIKKFKLGKFFKKESPVIKNEKYETFLNVSIQLDSYKTVNVRSSDEILDFIGDIGGFTDAVHMIFAVFGTFFSSKFIVSSLAKDMFLIKTK